MFCVLYKPFRCLAIYTCTKTSLLIHSFSLEIRVKIIKESTFLQWIQKEGDRGKDITMACFDEIDLVFFVLIQIFLKYHSKRLWKCQYSYFGYMYLQCSPWYFVCSINPQVLLHFLRVCSLYLLFALYM